MTLIISSDFAGVVGIAVVIGIVAWKFFDAYTGNHFMRDKTN